MNVVGKNSVLVPKDQKNALWRTFTIFEIYNDQNEWVSAAYLVE